MFALQRLDAGQVVAVVVGVESLVLLFNPFFSFVSISEDTNAKKMCFQRSTKQLNNSVQQQSQELTSWIYNVCFLLWPTREKLPPGCHRHSTCKARSPVESLYLVGAAQHVAALFCKLLQGAPAIIQLLHKPGVQT